MELIFYGLLLTGVDLPCGVIPVPNPIHEIIPTVGIRPTEFRLLIVGSYEFLRVICSVIQGH